VLFVSVAARSAARSVVAGRLVELGAVRGRIDAPPPWEVSQQAIVLLNGTDGLDGSYWPGLQVVIGASRSASELERGPDVPDARLDLGGPADEAVAGIDTLWADRLVPFEANLRKGRRAARRQQAILAGPDPAWAGQAACLIDRHRHSAGSQVMRIDHIGSTSVPGLRAKELIDIQVVVSDLVVAARVATAARRAGFVHVAGQWFGTDRWGADHLEQVAVAPWLSLGALRSGVRDLAAQGREVPQLALVLLSQPLLGPFQPGAVLPQRVVPGQVQQRDLGAGIRQEDSAVARRVPVVRHDYRGGAIPGNGRRVRAERAQAAEEVEVVAGCGPIDAADEAFSLPLGCRDGSAGRVPRHVAELAAPQDVSPVRVGGEAGHRPQPRLIQIGG
jgi:hypothetical protein